MFAFSLQLSIDIHLLSTVFDPSPALEVAIVTTLKHVESHPLKAAVKLAMIITKPKSKIPLYSTRLHQINLSPVKWYPRIVLKVGLGCDE